MNSPESSPWNVPPQREKTLRRKRAEKAARKAQLWGRRLDEAREIGPEEVAAVTWDRARAALEGLPDATRERAYQALTDAVDRVREQHAQ